LPTSFPFEHSSCEFDWTNHAATRTTCKLMAISAQAVREVSSLVPALFVSHFVNDPGTKANGDRSAINPMLPG
jgi:hypothetical protein